jgi:hypothetical protein
MGHECGGGVNGLRVSGWERGGGGIKGQMLQIKVLSLWKELKTQHITAIKSKALTERIHA